jgi:CDP-6-deoxy-D-xylo-4-hexulose-3-dehydrase
MGAGGAPPHGGTLAGNFGQIAATSTHAAHQISTGEGGLAFTSNDLWHAKMRRVRDWGRAYGAADLGAYYPGYVFSECGLNLHASDIQAAIGLVQLKRLPGLIAQRRANYNELLAMTASLPFRGVRTDRAALPSWYTFPMLCASQDERDRLAVHLAERGIESRPVVAGNMVRQPMCKADPSAFPGADAVFERGLWVSVHPRLSVTDLRRIAGALRLFWI